MTTQRVGTAKIIAIAIVSTAFVVVMDRIGVTGKVYQFLERLEGK